MKSSLVFLFGLVLNACFSQVPTCNPALLFRIHESSGRDQELNLLISGHTGDVRFGRYADIKFSSGKLASIRCTAAGLARLLELNLVERAELITAKKQVLFDTMFYHNRLQGLRAWTAPLPQAYDGSGVIMGIIDTGIDFTHPDFKNAQGQTRVLHLWDQTVANGTYTPQPYNYGREWSAAQINAGTCTHSDFPHYGHGTGVSGIACGNAGANGRFEGVAPACDMIVVALDFNKSGPTIADAVHYIVSKANTLGRPFVINASVGSYYGSHDGSDLEAQLIDQLIANQPGRVMVAAAGNAGDIPFHTRTQVNNGDTLFTWFSASGLNLETSCYATVAQVQNLKFSIGANRANYSDLGNIGFKAWNYALNTVRSDTLKHNNHRIGIVETSASVNSSGVFEWLVQIKADSSNLLWRVETTGQGLQDAWNFDFIDAPLPSPAQYPSISRYAKPDSLMNMVSSFQCSNEVLTVANYVNLHNFMAVNNSTVNTGEAAGALAANSSRGPTRDLRQKPDVAATGNSDIGAMCLAWQAYLLAVTPQVVAQGSMHVQQGGTSASAPVVAGFAALYLQKNPSATNRDIISAVQHCAYHDAFTGPGSQDPRWGYGKLDAKAAMLCNDPVVVLGTELPLNGNDIRVFPNPFTESLRLQMQESNNWQFSLYDAKGSLVLRKSFFSEHLDLSGTELSALPKGLYLLQLSASGQTLTFKLLRE
ncbi:MAG TPA: S8 family peptidase [Bacteroidia bacterium]|nr:S8 family peptidase [Bacteroidia bacterium]